MKVKGNGERRLNDSKILSIRQLRKQKGTNREEGRTSRSHSRGIHVSIAKDTKNEGKISKPYLGEESSERRGSERAGEPQKHEYLRKLSTKGRLISTI